MFSIPVTFGRLHNIARAQYRPPQLLHLIVDVFCAETKHGVRDIRLFLSGQLFLSFRDVTTIGWEILDESYERTMARLQQITCVGYSLELVGGFQFDSDILAHHPELNNIR